MSFGNGSGFWEMRKVHREERMDAPDQDPEELARSLEHVAGVDRWLGGARAARLHLSSLVEGRRSGSFLDVGTGDGTVLRRLVRWARRVGGPGWRGVGVELHPTVLAVAAARRRVGPDGTPGPSATHAPPPVALVRADARALPFTDDAFDAALCTLTLHHFEPPAARAVLADMARVSRSVILVSDLERNLASYVGARILAATVWRSNRITRHDGPLSVRRAYTRRELAELGRAAGLEDVEVDRHLPFRLVLEGRPPGRGS